MNTRSINVNNVNDFKTFLHKERATGFQPNLAICFSDAAMDFKAIGNYLAEENIDTIGTTTCGEIYDNTCVEGSCSVLLMDLDKDAYHIQLSNFEEGEDAAAREIAKVAQEKFSQPALITYASKVGVNGDKLVRAYKEELGAKTPIFGGLAGDNFKNEKFTVFSKDNYETEGIVALILDGKKVRVEGKAFSGWQALGMTHSVTRVDGNVLYELDNNPALDLFIEYFGLEKSSATAGETLEVIPGIYALKVIEDNDTDYFRSPLYYDRVNHSLILAGEVQEGDKVKFCPMPDIDTVSKTVDYFKSYAQSLTEVDSVIINTCAARKMAFGPLMDKEIKDIYKIWGVPTVGFMAMGEIGNHAKESECNFHNVTCSLVSLTEIK